MSLAKDNIWKLLAPLVVMGVMFLIPVPDNHCHKYSEVTPCLRRHTVG
ncbi:hypothetical protein ACUODJ_06985, partial [Escherichia sp. HC-CC]